MSTRDRRAASAHPTIERQHRGPPIPRASEDERGSQDSRASQEERFSHYDRASKDERASRDERASLDDPSSRVYRASQDDRASKHDRATNRDAYFSGRTAPLYSMPRTSYKSMSGSSYESMSRTSYGSKPRTPLAQAEYAARWRSSPPPSHTPVPSERSRQSPSQTPVPSQYSPPSPSQTPEPSKRSRPSRRSQAVYPASVQDIPSTSHVASTTTPRSISVTTSHSVSVTSRDVSALPQTDDSEQYFAPQETNRSTHASSAAAASSATAASHNAAALSEPSPAAPRKSAWRDLPNPRVEALSKESRSAHPLPSSRSVPAPSLSEPAPSRSVPAPSRPIHSQPAPFFAPHRAPQASSPRRSPQAPSPPVRVRRESPEKDLRDNEYSDDGDTESDTVVSRYSILCEPAHKPAAQLIVRSSATHRDYRRTEPPDGQISSRTCSSGAPARKQDIHSGSASKPSSERLDDSKPMTGVPVSRTGVPESEWNNYTALAFFWSRLESMASWRPRPYVDIVPSLDWPVLKYRTADSGGNLKEVIHDNVVCFFQFARRTCTEMIFDQIIAICSRVYNLQFWGHLARSIGHAMSEKTIVEKQIEIAMQVVLKVVDNIDHFARPGMREADASRPNGKASSVFETTIRLLCDDNNHRENDYHPLNIPQSGVKKFFDNLQHPLPLFRYRWPVIRNSTHDGSSATAKRVTEHGVEGFFVEARKCVPPVYLSILMEMCRN
ncbi:hypothetical protein BD626DRAFT_634650 [Schizophyllum amplum]|uniref:Uncharacterized protein n=1 Tax=Schizophyllum amplum TaxID=97359 RepID=A0A550BYP4_9AGAR|nr:hypothetical protein BD626DRAFT_634650 [Auriculariopsis ampla]